MMIEVIHDVITGVTTVVEAAYFPYIPTVEDVRAERSRILATVVDPLASNILRWGDLTIEQQQAWADYRRALLNVPQQAGFPENVIWPTAPNEVTA
jgi:hypothetical protein